MAGPARRRRAGSEAGGSARRRQPRTDARRRARGADGARVRGAPMPARPEGEGGEPGHAHRAGLGPHRATLIEQAPGRTYTGGSNVVDVVVPSLRKKIGPKVRGIGYRLRADCSSLNERRWPRRRSVTKEFRPPRPVSTHAPEASRETVSTGNVFGSPTLATAPRRRGTSQFWRMRSRACRRSSSGSSRGALRGRGRRGARGVAKALPRSPS